MTTPIRHILGQVNGRDWNGPFVDGRRRIFKTDGQAHWRSNGALLTSKEIQEEHFRYLTERLGWSESMVSNWQTGDYEPQPTTRIRDIQLFLDRLRKWHANHRPEEDTLRWLWATEYGGITDRPHWHLILFGLHHSDIGKVYDYWYGYSDGLGHIYPTQVQAEMRLASVMKGGAATYQAKDLVKSRHLFQRNPAVYDIERPRVDGSRRPAIGSGAYQWWLENWIGKVLRKAEETAPSDPWEREIHLVKFIRENYGIVSIPMPFGARNETFPTTNAWRRQLREDLGISDQVWEQVTQEQIKNDSIEAELIRGNVDGLGDEHSEHIRVLRERSEEIQGKERKRVADKRSWLLSTGRLRPDGGIGLPGLAEGSA